MRDARLRGRDRRDLSRIQMNAVTEHSMWREHSAFLVNVRVVARAHVKMVHFFELFAVLGEMSLEIRSQSRGQLGRAPHHFFRTSHREARTKRVLEPAIFGPMPFAAKPLALQQRNRENFFWLLLAIRAEIHHHFAEDRANPAFFGRLKSELAAVFINRGESHYRGRAVADEIAKKTGRLRARLWSSEFALDRKNMLAQPGKQFAFAACDNGVLRQMRVAIDQAGKNRAAAAIDPLNRIWP